MVNLNKEYYFTDQRVIQKTRCKKKQIILLNTGCSLDEHLTKLTNRYNKKYTKIPAFSVGKSGQIYQHIDPANYTQIIDNQELNKQSIVITIENIGWLTHNENTDRYFDWRGFAYSENIIEKQWRLKKYWADYTNEQYLALIELIDYLCIEYSIDKKFVGSNIVINKPNNFNGVLTRSNFSKNHYDLTPAFDFEKLIGLINN
jgi:hypothetical protein